MDSPIPIRRLPVIEVIDDATAAMYRAMTPAQRVRIATAMHREVRDFLGRYVRNTNPTWSDVDVHSEVIRMLTVVADDFSQPIILHG